MSTTSDPRECQEPDRKGGLDRLTLLALPYGRATDTVPLKIIDLHRINLFGQFKAEHARIKIQLIIQ
jgi:hypothetical protein